MIAIDLGSNTIRFVEYDGRKWGGSFEKIVKTAESLHETGRIAPNALKRVISAIHEAKEKIDFSSQTVRAYATAAMRMAANADEVLESIRNETGIAFEVIDGNREADLTLKAVRYRLQRLGKEPETFVMADIGGGSTEIIVVRGEEADTLSLNRGIVTLYESAEATGTLEAKIAEYEDLIRTSVSCPEPSLLVLTSGTPTTISAYLLGMDYQTYDPARINGYLLHPDDCLRTYHELLSMDESMRVRYVGVGRERLIGAGILMVTALFSALGFDEAVIVDDSLREGIALDYFDR